MFYTVYLFQWYDPSPGRVELPKQGQMVRDVWSRHAYCTCKSPLLIIALSIMLDNGKRDVWSRHAYCTCKSPLLIIALSIMLDNGKRDVWSRHAYCTCKSPLLIIALSIMLDNGLTATVTCNQYYLLSCGADGAR